MLARFRKDKRGASVATYALILPLFVVLIFGILEIWKVMVVRQSLYLGVYRAVRQVSAEGRMWQLGSAGQWEPAARERAFGIIDYELKNNALVPQGYTLRVQVVIEPEARGQDLRQLGWFFTVRAEVMAPGLVTLPMLNFDNVTLVEKQVSYIEGLSGSWIPPEEGPPY